MTLEYRRAQMRPFEALFSSAPACRLRLEPGEPAPGLRPAARARHQRRVHLDELECFGRRADLAKCNVPAE